MDTKLKSDIAESALVTQLLMRWCRVLRPAGDRLPYDLAVDREGQLIRIQVKSAWRRKQVWIVDVRRTRTNRRRMVRAPYNVGDFDIAAIYLHETGEFVLLPVDVFCSYKSEITIDTQPESRLRRYFEDWACLI